MVVVTLPKGNAAFEPSLEIEMNLHHDSTQASQSNKYQ